MIILSATNHKLELETGAAVSTDWSVSWADRDADEFSRGSGQGNVTTAATTDISGSPATGYQRMVSEIAVTNRSTTTAQTVRVKKDVGGTDYYLTPEFTLQPGETLQYLHGHGFSVIEGRGAVVASPKVLGQAAPLAATLTTLYTVPATKAASVRAIHACNRSATATSFRVAVRPGGASISDEHYIHYDVPIGGNDTVTLDEGLDLAAGDVISVYATLATLSFSAFGEELS